MPLKYDGLSYTENWISEAQERMVLSVPPEKWTELSVLAASEGVATAVIGKFVPTGRLVLTYGEHQVSKLTVAFVHAGRPRIVRVSLYSSAKPTAMAIPQCDGADCTVDLLKILGSLNVANTGGIRQCDHEVQGGSVVEPLVGVTNDGPSDATDLRTMLRSRRGLVVARGMIFHCGRP